MLFLVQIKKLRSKLDEIWMSSQGSVVLFMWMNFLQNDLLDSLRVTPPLLVNGETLAAILDYDQTMQNKVLHQQIMKLIFKRELY